MYLKNNDGTDGTHGAGDAYKGPLWVFYLLIISDISDISDILKNTREKICKCGDRYGDVSDGGDQCLAH